MKTIMKFTIEVESIMEINKESEQEVRNAYKNKKPLFTEEEKEELEMDLINVMGIKLDEIKIGNESYEIIEE